MDPRWQARSGVPADYDTFARLFCELGVDDPVPDRARWEAEMLPGTLLLEHGGAPVAYAWANPLRGTAHVFHVVVDPARRGQGAGGAVMEAIAERLRAAGCSRWSLNVKIDNVPAIRLYERWGMERVHRSASLSLPWDRLAALPREPAEVVARPIEPAEDGALEAAFSIVTGRLADLRARGRVLLQLVDAARPSEPAGVASFDPSFPGAYPFAVAWPALAAPLLEGLRPHARPGDAFLRLMVEHDAALVEVLRGAGAAVKLEMFHMEGEIPAAG